MSSGEITCIVFACVFGSAMLGLALGKVLPKGHLDDRSKDIVKLSTGLIATMSALVLGLLVSSAKGTFERVNNELMQIAVKIVVLDRVLAQYGPETKEVRALMKERYAAATEQLLSGDDAQQEKLSSSESIALGEGIQGRIRELSPQNDEQRGLKARAIEISSELATSRWLLALQRNGSISTPMLGVMVFWLSIIFAAWGLFSPRNLVVAAALLASALAVSGATLLILELDRPLSGWIRVSPAPVHAALSHLGE